MALKDLLIKFIDWAFGGSEIQEDPEYKNYKETLEKLMKIVNSDKETYWTTTGAGVLGFSDNDQKVVHLFCKTKYFELFDMFIKEKGKKKVNALGFASNYKRTICSAVGVTIDGFDFSYAVNGLLVVNFNVDSYKSYYVYRSPKFMEKTFPKDKPTDYFLFNEYRKDFCYYGLTTEFENEQIITKYPEDWKEKWK